MRAVHPCLAGLAAAGIGLIAVPAWSAARSPQPPRTLADLAPAAVEIRREPAADAEANAALAMDSYRRFLALPDTDPAMRAEALRRLADLSLEGGEGGQLDDTAAQPELGGAEAIRLYSDLLQAYPDYPRNDRVMYQLARAWEISGQPEQALATLDEITRRHPASDAMAEVQFRRGELLFSARRYREAEQAYAQVASRGAGEFYQQALYKQGWSLFKLSLHDESLAVFARLLDAQLLDAGSRSGFRPLDTLARADHELVDDTLRAASVMLADLDGVASLGRLVDRLGAPAWSPLLFAALGDLYVSKQRYQDAAATYRAFVARDPRNESSPLLSTRAIEAYGQGGFAQLVLEGKREYVDNYNLGSAFWDGRDPADYPQVVGQTRTHLMDLAAWYHAQAQASGEPAQFLEAARWYRLRLASFPDDAEAAQVNYRLANALFEGGRFGEAVTEYERSAYAYAPGPDSARAGYAALDAYARQEPLLPEAERAQWKLRAIESGVRFSQAFPEHADATGVLVRAAQDLYTMHELARAVEVAGVLLAHQPPADAAQRRIAHSVAGQAHFDLGDYALAESDWQQAGVLAVDAAERARLADQVAVAVYRQAEARRDAGDLQEAAQQFLRVAAAAPGTAVVETARYDAAAAYISLEQWPRAIEVLEAFQRDYPESANHGEATQKLAVAYMNAGRAHDAAMQFEQVAADPGQSPQVRREALSLAAAQYDQVQDRGRVQALLEVLVQEFPEPVAERIEDRQRLADFAREAGDVAGEQRWLRQIVAADAAAGAARTARTRYLAALASLALAEPARDAFRAVALRIPLDRSLAAKRTALADAMNAYRDAAAYDVAEVTTRARFEMAELYRRLAEDLMTSERPRDLAGDELEQYDLLLEEQALPFEEQAIEAHEANARHALAGLYDEGVRASYVALAGLLPARFGKTELVPDYLPAAGQDGTAAQAHGRGVMHLAEGRPEEAEAAFAEALALEPGNAASLVALGVARRRRGDFTGALQAYQSALAVDPDQAAAWRDMAVLQDLYMGDPAAALAGFERYQALTGEQRPVTSWIADVKQRAGVAVGAPATTGEEIQ